jgi:hypothetical protein
MTLAVALAAKKNPIMRPRYRPGNQQVMNQATPGK